MTEGDLADIGWVMWAGTIGLESPVSARIEAAPRPDASVCRSVPLTFFTPSCHHPRSGAPPRDAGLDLVIDPILGWCGDERLPGPYRRAEPATRCWPSPLTWVRWP